MEVLENVLLIPYKELSVSNSFKRFFAIYEIPTLEKLLEIKPVDLMKMKWFNAQLLLELIELLESNGIEMDGV